MSIQESFSEFHEANPWVYRDLVKLARDLKNRGRKKIGIGMLFEVLRWNWQMTTADPNSDFKLNNNYRSRYSRMIMTQERDLEGIFDVRELQTV